MEATVPITDADADAEDLRVYVWNGSVDQTWNPVKTDVDTQNGTATAFVQPDHYVTVLNRTAWQDAITVERKKPRGFGSGTSVDCIQDCAVDGEDARN